MGPFGHLGIGFAAKLTAPKTSLWALLTASEVPEIAFFALEAVGVEKGAVYTTDFRQGVNILTPGSISWSHGLFMCVVWSVVMAVIAYLFYRDRRTSIVTGLMVLGHWLLDFVVHPTGVPLLFDSSPWVGLRLQSSGFGLIVNIILELALFAGGIAVYLVTRKGKATLVRVKS